MQKIRTADRRSEPRHELTAEATLLADGQSLSGMLSNISSGGAALRIDTSRLPASPRELRLRITGSPVDARVSIVNKLPYMVSLAFTDRDAGEAAMRWLTSRAGVTRRAA